MVWRQIPKVAAKCLRHRAISYPHATVFLGERPGRIAAHEGQFQWRLQIVQQRPLNVILIGDVIDLDAGTSGDGSAQLDIRMYEHGDLAEGHGRRCGT